MATLLHAADLPSEDEEDPDFNPSEQPAADQGPARKRQRADNQDASTVQAALAAKQRSDKVAAAFEALKRQRLASTLGSSTTQGLLSTAAPTRWIPGEAHRQVCSAPLAGAGWRFALL